MSKSPSKIDDILDKEETHLLDYLIVLAKYSRIIILTSLLSAVLFYILLVILPDKYTATARVLPPQLSMTISSQLLNSLSVGSTPGYSSNVGGIGAMGGGMAGVASGLLGMKTTADLYVGIMNGDTIFDHIIESFKLREVYKEKYIEDARKALATRVKIGVGKKDGIIAIEVTDKDRMRAAAIANAFVDKLNSLMQDLSVQEAKVRLAFLDKERLQANSNLTNSEDALRSFSEKNSVIQIDVQTKDMLLYIARLRAEIDAKEIQIQVMRQHATSNNFDVVSLETEVKGLKSKLKATEKQYDQICVGEACLPTSKVPALGLEYMRLYREVKFQEGLYLFYTKMAELARLDLVKDFSVAQVVDKALPPEKRSNKRLIPTLLFGISSFIVLVIFLCAREAWEKAELSAEDAQRYALLKRYLHPYFKNITYYCCKNKKDCADDNLK
jgi:tyrosine-protein kinase Etk/Wzc